MSKLTDKQELFCYEYLKDFNARQAAIRSGYSPRSASVAGSRNLINPAVSVLLRRLINERKARLETSADYVLQRFLEIDRLDLADILDKDGKVLPVNQWTQDWRNSIAAVDIQEVKSELAVIKKIRLPDKLKNLELIGKHIDVSAFRDRAEQTGTGSRELVIHVTAGTTKDELSRLKDSLSTGD